jgi:hypothetical protein
MSQSLSREEETWVPHIRQANGRRETANACRTYSHSELLPEDPSLWANQEDPVKGNKRKLEAQMPGPYQGNSQPEFVYRILRPPLAFLVSLQIMPSMATAVVHEQSPARVVSKRLVARMWDVQQGIHV